MGFKEPIQKKPLKLLHAEMSFSNYLARCPPFVDWSRLETLYGVTMDDHFIEQSMDGSVLSSLKSLSLTCALKNSAFLSVLPPLQFLCVIQRLNHFSLPKMRCLSFISTRLKHHDNFHAGYFRWPNHSIFEIHVVILLTLYLT